MACLGNRASSGGRRGQRRPARCASSRSRSIVTIRIPAGNPRLDTFEVDLDDCGPMVLDALIWIKNKVDSTLTFRRSCREGICGSCSMNIDGDELARLHAVHFRLGDAGDDLSSGEHADHQGSRFPISRISSRNMRRSSLGSSPRLRSPNGSGSNRRRSAAGSTATTNAFSASAVHQGCPSHWWNGDRFLGPAVLLQAWRWLTDSRDEGTGERLDNLEDPFRLYRCHTILNCTRTCPKGLNPGKAIAEIKKMSGRAPKLIAERGGINVPIHDGKTDRDRFRQTFKSIGRSLRRSYRLSIGSPASTLSGCAVALVIWLIDGGIGTGGLRRRAGRYHVLDRSGRAVRVHLRLFSASLRRHPPSGLGYRTWIRTPVDIHLGLGGCGSEFGAHGGGLGLELGLCRVEADGPSAHALAARSCDRPRLG